METIKYPFQNGSVRAIIKIRYSRAIDFIQSALKRVEFVCKLMAIRSVYQKCVFIPRNESMGRASKLTFELIFF